MLLVTVRILATERGQAFSTWERQLTAMASDRRAAIDAWLGEQAGHAALVASFPTVRASLGGSAPPDLPHLVELMDLAAAAHPGATLRLFDREGEPVATSGASGPRCRECAALAVRVVERGQSQIQLDPSAAAPAIAFAAPVTAPRDGDHGAPAPVVGAVLLSTPADRWLYPLLAQTPFVTRTAETLLVEKDGGAVLSRSPAGPAPGAASHAASVTGLLEPGDSFARGRAGELRDPRGVPVVAVSRELVNAPWALVAKVDRAEVVDQVGRETWVAIGEIWLGFAALAAVGVAGARRRWRAMRQHITRTESRLTTLADQVDDGILVLDAEGRILEANRSAERIYGHREAALQSMHLHELRRPGSGTDLLKRDGVAWRGTRGLVETTQTRGDGSTFPAEISLRELEHAGERLVLAVIRDITDRRASEKRIHQLNRVLRTLSLVNQTTVKARNRAAFLDTTCKILVEFGGYDRACVSFADPFAGRLVPTAAADTVRAERRGIGQSGDPASSPGDLIHRALCGGRHVVSNDVATDPRLEPWRSRFAELGVRSAAAFPLVVRGQVVGALGIHTANADAFEADDLALLDELALNVAHGVEMLMDRDELADTEVRLRDALRAAQSSSTRFLTVFEYAPIGIGLADGASKVMCAVNPALATMLGYAPEELVGIHPKRLWHPDELPLRDDIIERIRSSDGVPAEFRTVLRRKDGTPIPVRGLLTSIRDASADPQYVLGVFEDETARLAAESRLSKLSRAIEQSPISVVITDREGRIEYVNRKFCEVSGYTFEEALGQNPRILKSGANAPEHYRDLWETITAGGEWHGELRNRKKNGELFWEDATISPLRDEHDRITHFIAVKEDVTVRKRAEQELLQTQQQLEVAQRMEAIGLLAGGVAHDFNNMLSAILGFSELAKRDLKQGDRVRELIDQVTAAGRRASSLTRQLLAFSRRTNAEPRLLDVGSVITDLEKMLRRLIAEHIRLTIDLPADLPPVEIDPGQLEQVVVNLVVNARDAMPQGGELRIATSSVEVGNDAKPDLVPGRYVIIRVSDDGVGMTDEVQARIFEPFFTTKEIGKGTGLGLSTVYGIVRGNGGTIEVESAVGVGTTFDVYLRAAASAARSSASPTVATTRAPGGCESVLIVEDDDLVRAVTSRMLRDAGYRVLAAGNPGEAYLIAARAEETIDLLLSDVMMPLMNGRELAAKIHELRPGLPVLFMSGYTEDDEIRTMALSPAGGFLQKPVELVTLLTMLRRVLDAHAHASPAAGGDRGGSGPAREGTAAARPDRPIESD